MPLHHACKRNGASRQLQRARPEFTIWNCFAIERRGAYLRPSVEAASEPRTG
jgi:hypothetical protein